MEQQSQELSLTRSPHSGRLRVGTVAGKHLLRADDQPVAPTPDCREPVLVNVYDLHWINRMAKKLHLAAYHSGLELHGVEIAYGDCGVYRMKPKDVEAMESKMAFKKSVHLGFTDYSRQDAVLISKHLGKHVFTGASYDLLRQNCNHFSAALSALLCKERLEFPSWINSLASVGTRLPFVERGIRHFTDADDEADEGGDSQQADAKKPRSGGLREVCANLSRASSAALSSGSSGSSGDCGGGGAAGSGNEQVQPPAAEKARAAGRI